MNQQRMSQRQGGAQALARKASVVLTLLHRFWTSNRKKKGAGGWRYGAVYLIHISESQSSQHQSRVLPIV